MHLLRRDSLSVYNACWTVRLRQETLTPTPELVEALRALDKKAVKEAMQGLLHSMQVSAMMKRRDKLLKEFE